MVIGMRKIAVLAFAAATVLAACNSSSSTIQPAGGGTSSGGSSSSNGEVSTTDISGFGKVLQAPSGLTLYHLTSEDKGTISCTGSCTSLWFPLTASGGQAPTSMASLPKKFGTVARPDGTMQATYDGFPLYTYVGDTAAGQANGNGIPGEGIPGTWYAVTPTGTPSTATVGTGTSTGGSGYGNGNGGGGGGGYGY
jgi:predicted lipoprotein with Yx(FWY)xxD motif